MFNEGEKEVSKMSANALPRIGESLVLRDSEGASVRNFVIVEVRHFHRFKTDTQNVLDHEIWSEPDPRWQYPNRDIIDFLESADFVKMDNTF